MEIKNVKKILLVASSALVALVAIYYCASKWIDVYWTLLCLIVPIKLFLLYVHPLTIAKKHFVGSELQLIDKIRNGDIPPQNAAIAVGGVFAQKPLNKIFVFIWLGFVWFFQHVIPLAGLFHWDTFVYILSGLVLKWLIDKSMLSFWAKYIMPILLLAMLIHHFTTPQ